MPRPRRPGAPEPKRRSRKGCWPCKARKVKCGEEKPSCVNCERQGEVCDYSIRLNWDGRSKRTSSVGSSNSPGDFSSHVMSFSLPSVDSAGTDISTGQPPDSSGAPADNRSPDQTPLTPASYPVLIGGLHDSPVANNRPDHLGYGSKKSPTMSPPSQTQGMSATWDHTAPFPAHQEPLDGTPYPSPEDTNSSIASLNTFGFTPTSVSQPTSFLRQSVDVDYASERDTWPDRLPKRARLQPPFSADPFGVYGRDGPSESSRECNAHPLDTGVPMLPGIGQEIPNSSPSASTPAGEIFAKLVDEQLAPSASPGDSCASTIERPPIQKGADSGLTGSVSNAKRKWKDYLSNVEDNYGLDCGRPDLDLNKNDDHAAIDVNSALKSMIPGRRTSHTGQYSSRNTEYAYYASPVPINIPRHLSPLPSLLLDNPINLMYFHHYINHTARILIPHDCENNPFSSVMPSMAISDPNLLNLLLAYSASHRARCLEHPEPANRIAHLVSDVFPNLRLALDGPHENITESHLATAMMLLSLKIISPSTFEVPITWQSHLKLARDLFLARLDRLSQPGNRVGAFFARWLGFLDIFGTLSCRHNEPPLLVYNSVLSNCCAEGYDELSVDCFTGFTPRTGEILTRLGRLVHQCDNERFDGMGVFDASWRPSADNVVEAETLMGELAQLSELAHASGKHFEDSGPLDMVAIDKAFRYAGMLHLHRRVLCTPPSSPPVEDALSELTMSLTQIRHGAPAEVGALFPLFTAGCETRDPQQRQDIMERFNILERAGMKQIQHARQLVQRCWDEDLPWIALAQGEFLG